MDDDPARMSRIDFLQEQIRELLELADACAESTPTASVSARKEAAALRKDLDQLRAYEADLGAQRTPIEEARAMRLRADAAGSHVAARDLFKVELDLIAKAEAARQAEEAERLANLTEAQILSMLLEQLRALPAHLLERLLGELGDGDPTPCH